MDTEQPDRPHSLVKMSIQGCVAARQHGQSVQSSRASVLRALVFTVLFLLAPILLFSPIHRSRERRPKTKLCWGAMSIVTLDSSTAPIRECSAAGSKPEELSGCVQAATGSLPSDLGATQPVEVGHRSAADLNALRLGFLSKQCTAFRGNRILSFGPLIEVALVVKCAFESGEGDGAITFDDATGAVVDLDLGGSKPEFLVRLCEQATKAAMAIPNGIDGSSPQDCGDAGKIPRGRGRPKLGVVSREVTLLPRHWEWLAAQPGGTSVMMRRLVDQACGTDHDQSSAPPRREAAHRFISTIARDCPNFDEAASALLSGNREKLEKELLSWPADLRAYTLKLGFGIAPQTTECKEAFE